MNKIYSQRRQEGKCSSCGNPSRPGKAFCQDCANKRKLSFQEKRKLGICTECSKPVVAGRTRCAYHLEQRTQYQKQLAKNRIDQNLCPNCGKRTPEDGKRLCQRCRGYSLNNVHQQHFNGNRKLVLERDNHQCQICHSDKYLIVHHKDDKSFGNIEPNHEPSNLITLCRHCHAAITKLRSNNRGLAAELILY